MKRVVSVSLGSAKRDHTAVLELLGERIQVERIGTDGDREAAAALIKELDGKVDAIGLGGIDLYLYAGDKRYILREGKKLASQASRTPVVDGSGLKNTLENRVILQLAQEGYLSQGTKVLLVSGVDRQGMAQALDRVGCRVTYGDLIFSFGLPIPIRSLRALNTVAEIVAPVACQLPFKYLYPTGKEQETVKGRHSRYYQEADIIAGDFHYIRRHLPENLEGKLIVTNTVTPADLTLLEKRGVRLLITTTPDIDGRSFGTNVLEGALVALAGSPVPLEVAHYSRLLDQIGFKPRLVKLASARIS